MTVFGCITISELKNYLLSTSLYEPIILSRYRVCTIKHPNYSFLASNYPHGEFFNYFQNEDEDTQQENTTSDQENQEESVDDLLERAENMIRENAQHCNQVSIPEASVANNEWIQQSNAPQGSFTENNANSSGQITDPVAEAVRKYRK